MTSFIKFIGKLIFLLLLGAHFLFLILIFAPTPKLLYLLNDKLEMIEPETIPKELKKLETEKDLVPQPNLIYKNSFTHLTATLLEWRRKHFMADDDKLAFDLSTLNFGEQIIGLNAASNYYFKKPLKELSSDQWITLVNLNRIFLK